MFTGEVSGGLLGQPAGQVFFSPALENSAANSVIQIDSVQVCTRAYDQYEFPELPDPTPIYTFGPSSTGATIGSGVLWAPAWRLGLVEMDLSDAQEDTVATAVSGPCDITLEEPIDITAGGFLNDSRWRIFPGAPDTDFTIINNLAPVGPGPTINQNLE
jgi:hypothetical protein